MRRWLLVAAAGCGSVDDGTPWQDAASAGVELGPLPTLRAAPGCTLRIASWNVHGLSDPDDLVAHLAASQQIANADVLFLQETAQYPGEDQTRSAQLATTLAMTWAHVPVHLLRGGVMQGNAILSRFALDDVEVKRLPTVGHGQARFALAADVMVGERRVRVVDVHLEVRIQMTDRIRQLDPAVLEERAVIGGDFNTAPWQWVEGIVPLTSTEAVVGQNQAAVLDDYMASREFAGAIAPDVDTFTLAPFGMRLDNLYARDIPIAATGIERIGGSDHYPIWFDIDVCN